MTVELFDDDQPEGPSRSQVKRDHQALQKLAERLATMPRAEVERLTLSAATRAALDETARIKDLRARGRHWKRIANLLQREDMDAVNALLHHKEQTEREAAARHHRVERWRERLIDDADQALTEFLDAYPETDRQHLRQLVRAARRDREKGRADAPRKLFRFLRGIIDDINLS